MYWALWINSTSNGFISVLTRAVGLFLVQGRRSTVKVYIFWGAFEEGSYYLGYHIRVPYLRK